jgi:hypothetical protein
MALQPETVGHAIPRRGYYASLRPSIPRCSARRAAAGISQEARRGVIDDLAVRVNVAVASTTPFVEWLVHFWPNHVSASLGKPL